MITSKIIELMKNLTLSALLLSTNVCFFVFGALAQGNLNGIVIDEDDKGPIPFANVALKQNDEIVWSTTTDYEGYFYFDHIDRGNYSFFTHAAGNSKEFTDIRVDKADLTYTLAMNQTSYMDTVIVVGHKGLIQTAHIASYDPEFIENIGAINITDVETMGSANVETSEGISYKGARPGTAVYYIDGIRTYGELYIPMNAVSQIEIYNGGIPARYGNTTSAVIVVESKSYFDEY